MHINRNIFLHLISSIYIRFSCGFPYPNAPYWVLSTIGSKLSTSRHPLPVVLRHLGHVLPSPIILCVYLPAIAPPSPLACRLANTVVCDTLRWSAVSALFVQVTLYEHPLRSRCPRFFSDRNMAIRVSFTVTILTKEVPFLELKHL